MGGRTGLFCCFFFSSNWSREGSKHWSNFLGDLASSVKKMLTFYLESHLIWCFTSSSSEYLSGGRLVSFFFLPAPTFSFSPVGVPAGLSDILDNTCWISPGKFIKDSEQSSALTFIRLAAINRTAFQMEINRTDNYSSEGRNTASFPTLRLLIW